MGTRTSTDAKKERILVIDEAICNIRTADTELLGAGASGTIFSHDNEIVIKAYRDKTHCTDVYKEYLLQKTIHNLFKHAPQKYESRIEVSQPIKFCRAPDDRSPYIFNKEEYFCFIVMSKLHGVTFETLKNVLPDDIFKNWDETKLAALDPNMAIQVHPALNNNIKKNINILHAMHQEGAFMDADWFEWTGDTEKPLRGYFATQSNFGRGSAMDKLLHGTRMLRKKDAEFNAIFIEKTIGFVYGVMVEAAKLYPIDIEFTLGQYNDVWKINVLDFDLVEHVGTDDEAKQREKLTHPVFGFHLQPYGNLEMEYVKAGWDEALKAAEDIKSKVKIKGKSRIESGSHWDGRYERVTVGKEGGLRGRSMTMETDVAQIDFSKLKEKLSKTLETPSEPGTATATASAPLKSAASASGSVKAPKWSSMKTPTLLSLSSTKPAGGGLRIAQPLKAADLKPADLKHHKASASASETPLKSASSASAMYGDYNSYFYSPRDVHDKQLVSAQHTGYLQPPLNINTIYTLIICSLFIFIICCVCNLISFVCGMGVCIFCKRDDNKKHIYETIGNEPDENQLSV